MRSGSYFLHKVGSNHDSVLLKDGMYLGHECTIVFHPTALKGRRDIVFNNGVQMGGRVSGKSLSGLYLKNSKV